MAVSKPRQLTLGAILAGVGTDQASWLDPELKGDASIDIDWYIDNARLAEAAKFDLVFIVDSPFITPDTAPHFLNRLEPLTLLSAVAGATRGNRAGGRPDHLLLGALRGLFRSDYEHDTLRGRLGLPIPENRWTRGGRTPSLAAE